MKMNKKFLLVPIACVFLGMSFGAQAQSNAQGWSLRPAFGAGYNKAQGSYYSLGLSLQNWWSESILLGIGAYYSVGSPSVSTQGYGAGPFVAYFYPVTEFLTFEAREAIEYVSQRTPLAIDDTQYVTDQGVISATSVGLHLNLLDHVGLSGGYRYVLAIDNSDLDDDRSGVYLGLGIYF